MSGNSTKIYVINLPSSRDRRMIMEKQLKKFDLPYEIFEAVNGSTLTEEEILKYYDREYYMSRPDYFTPGAAGCTLSHYFIYKKMLAENIDSALILEDDMVLHPDLPQLLPKLAAASRPDEVVLLFYQSYFPIELSEKNAESISRGYDLYQVSATKGLRSTGGYFINNASAKRMVENLLPFKGFADDWKGFYEQQVLNGIRVVYPFLLNNTYEGTTISPNVKGGIVAAIVPFLDRNKIFPFHQLLRWRRKRNIESTRKCVFKNESPVDFRADQSSI